MEVLFAHTTIETYHFDMNLLLAIVLSGIIPLKNYTNYSLILDFSVCDSSIFLATNGGVIKFRDVVQEGDSAVYKGFSLYGSAHGLPHNIVLSVCAENDTVWAVPLNSGLYYKLPYSNEFRRYFIPYAGIKSAKTVRKSDDIMFLQLARSLLRIKLNGNLDPDDDNVFVITSDSTGAIDVYGDTLYYSKKDTLFVQHVLLPSPEDAIVFPQIITAVLKKTNIVVGTEGGVYIKDGNTFTHFQTGRVYSLYEKNDTIFAACSDGAYLIHDGTINHIDTDKSHAFFEFKGRMFTNRITSATNVYYNGGLYALFDNGFIPLYSGIPTNFITTMGTDGKNLFVGTLDWGDKPMYLKSKAFCINPKTNSVFFVDSIGNSTSDAIRIVRYGNKKVFFGAYALDSKGLFVYDNGVVEHLTHFPSLLFTDLWVGEDTFLALWGDGIYRWSGGNTSMLYDVNYPSWISVDAKRRVWIGTEASGIVVVDAMGNVIRAINYELPSPAITALLSSDSLMAVGTDGGLVLFDMNFVPHRIMSNTRIRSLAVDRFRRLYALTDSALYFINTSDYTARMLLSSPPIVPVQAADWEVRNVLVVDDDLNMYVGGKEGILVLKLDEPEYGKGSIKVFPNPVIRGEKITVCAESSFIVTTLNGKKIEKFNEGCHVLSTKNLFPGLYIITTKDGERGKFVIKEKR